MKIYLTNNKTIEDINEEMISKIADQLQSGALGWAVFKDQNGKILLIINLRHILFIK